MHNVSLILVWLTAAGAVLLYIQRLGVKMKQKPMAWHTPEGKLERAATMLIKARALLNVAEHLTLEAGVPRVAALVRTADRNVDEAARIVDLLVHAEVAPELTSESPIDLVGTDDRPTIKTETRHGQ